MITSTFICLPSVILATKRLISLPLLFLPSSLYCPKFILHFSPLIVLSKVHSAFLPSSLYCPKFILHFSPPHCTVQSSFCISPLLIVLSKVHSAFLPSSLYCPKFILHFSPPHCTVQSSFCISLQLSFSFQVVFHQGIIFIYRNSFSNKAIPTTSM